MTLFNADDYGMTKLQSKHILDCYHEGVLTGVSIMPNSGYINEANEFLKECKDIHVAIHLNITEGCSISEKEKVTLLVDETGRFKQSFF